MRVWNWLSWRDSRPRFVSPLNGVKRAVVLEPLFRPGAELRWVDPEAVDAATSIRAERPAVLAGTVGSLLNLAAALGPAVVTHALVVFTRTGEACLTDEQRDRLWDRFGIPVFEQILDEDGRVAAWECEAHNGFHLAKGAQPASGCSVETGACDCGADSPRMLSSAVAPRFTGGDSSPRLTSARLTSSTRPIAT